MTPQEIAAQLQQLGPDRLKAMDWMTLLQARRHVPLEQQNLIAPYEHRAYARETVQHDPLAALGLAVGAIGYQPYKMLTGEGRSTPSMKTMTEGLTGVGEGLWAAFQQATAAKGGSAPAAQPTGGDLLASLKGFLRKS